MSKRKQDFAPKAGVRSTEFWLTIGLAAISALLARLDAIDREWAVVAAAVCTAVYAGGRAWVKASYEKRVTIRHYRDRTSDN